MNSALENETGDVALDEYLQSFGDDLAAALVGSGRTLLINVDNVGLTTPTAQAIGRLVLDLVVNGLAVAMEKGTGIVQIACGVNRGGGLTLEITDDGVGAEGMLEPLREVLAATQAPGLVTQLGGSMVVETTEKGLCCTIAMPIDGH